MDPLTMMAISGIVGGGSSLLGSLFNTSSQQSINAAQMANAQYVNTGQNLPQYYSNLFKSANQQGINPLAMLGQRGPDVVANLQAPTPGAGLSAIGQNLQSINPFAFEQADIARRKGEADIAYANQMNMNARVAGAKDSWMLNALKQYAATHDGWIPEGIQPANIQTSTVDEAHAMRDASEAGWGVIKHFFGY